MHMLAFKTGKKERNKGGRDKGKEVETRKGRKS